MTPASFPNGEEYNFLEDGQQLVACVGSPDGSAEVVITTARLIEIWKKVRTMVSVLVMGGLRVVVMDRDKNMTLTIDRSGAGTHLKFGIPLGGTHDQILRFAGGRVFADRGDDAVPSADGERFVSIYPLPDQGGAFKRPTID